MHFQILRQIESYFSFNFLILASSTVNNNDADSLDPIEAKIRKLCSSVVSFYVLLATSPIQASSGP